MTATNATRDELPTVYSTLKDAKFDGFCFMAVVKDGNNVVYEDGVYHEFWDELTGKQALIDVCQAAYSNFSWKKYIFYLQGVGRDDADFIDIDWAKEKLIKPLVEAKDEVLSALPEAEVKGYILIDELKNRGWSHGEIVAMYNDFKSRDSSIPGTRRVFQTMIRSTNASYYTTYIADSDEVVLISEDYPFKTRQYGGEDWDSFNDWRDVFVSVPVSFKGMFFQTDDWGQDKVYVRPNLRQMLTLAKKIKGNTSPYFIVPLFLPCGLSTSVWSQKKIVWTTKFLKTICWDTTPNPY